MEYPAWVERCPSWAELVLMNLSPCRLRRNSVEQDQSLDEVVEGPPNFGQPLNENVASQSAQDKVSGWPKRDPCRFALHGSLHSSKTSETLCSNGPYNRNGQWY